MTNQQIIFVHPQVQKIQVMDKYEVEEISYQEILLLLSLKKQQPKTPPNSRKNSMN